MSCWPGLPLSVVGPFFLTSVLSRKLSDFLVSVGLAGRHSKNHHVLLLAGVTVAYERELKKIQNVNPSRSSGFQGGGVIAPPRELQELDATLNCIFCVAAELFLGIKNHLRCSADPRLNSLFGLPCSSATYPSAGPTLVVDVCCTMILPPLLLTLGCSAF